MTPSAPIDADARDRTQAYLLDELVGAGFRNSPMMFVGSSIFPYTSGRKFANLPAATDLRTLAATIKARWICEQAHQQLKEELGLDHFEGRSWPGLHHHAALCFLAYGFLALERARGTATVLADPA